MNRVLLRIIFTVNIFIYLFVSIYGQAAVNYLNSNSVILIAASIFMTLGTFYLWGNMFYHWGTVQFKEVKVKTVWFWSMILGLFIGAYIYYLCVYEFRRTLTDNK